MASGQRRKELVNELRKAHFTLGFESNKYDASEYVHKYKEHQLQAASLLGGGRDHHYSLGGDEPIDYQSEFKYRYAPHGQTESAGLSEYKKNDLRKYHFNLGFDEQKPGSTYAANYDKKSSEPPPADKKEKLMALRKHNHDFGDTLTYFSSMYNEKYNKNLYDHQAEQKGKIDGNLLRKTNMILGDQQPRYVSQTADVHNLKPTAAVHPVKRYEGNVDLGSDEGKFVTSHRRDFAHKEGYSSGFDKKVIQDFRSAHFHFGTAPNAYLSENKDQYNEKPITIPNNFHPTGTYVQLAHGHEDTHNSTYKDAFLGMPADKAIPIRRGDNSVVMGSDPKQFTTEHQSNFLNHPRQDNNLPNDRKKVLAGTSLDLGGDPRDFTTQHRGTYADRFLYLQRSGLSEKEFAYLQKKHFDYGFQGTQYNTHNQDYGVRQGPANKLNEYVQKGMRRTNINDHDPDIKKSTTYKTSFHWKQNPDL